MTSPEQYCFCSCIYFAPHDRNPKYSGEIEDLCKEVYYVPRAKNGAAVLGIMDKAEMLLKLRMPIVANGRGISSGSWDREKKSFIGDCNNH
ncbi:hypothetical protein TNCT_434711 [Trichonephila clavata]|uniref:Uncharacterized protein n=1 Tax=Trichonephila clavata TaxID=2740835 RepID=A0A8X6GYW3_TRICU|nr:hypothetical protein TNCT_434711 [Trichonephila clavata]